MKNGAQQIALINLEKLRNREGRGVNLTPLPLLLQNGLSYSAAINGALSSIF